MEGEGEGVYDAPYENGESIRQAWNGAFVFFAFATSFVASYSAVRLCDHNLWWRNHKRGGGGRKRGPRSSSASRASSHNHAAAAAAQQRHRDEGTGGAAAAGDGGATTEETKSAATTSTATSKILLGLRCNCTNYAFIRSLADRLRPRPATVASFLLGFGTVWSMHFVGMSAVALEAVPTCYDWPKTFASLVCAVALMYAGVCIASRDVFGGPDRQERLREMVMRTNPNLVNGRSNRASTSRSATTTVASLEEQRERTRKTIRNVAYFHKPFHILTGGVVASSGALTMHYVGMSAVEGPFHKVWDPYYIAGSVLYGATVCVVGFWIIFRLFHWKIEEYWLRPLCAAVIAAAVCGLHFLGMLSVTYVYDDTMEIHSNCRREIERDALSPQAWTSHQIMVLTVIVLVWSFALVVESVLYRELLGTYVKLYDPSMNFVLHTNGRSGGSGGSGSTRNRGNSRNGRNSKSNHTPNGNEVILDEDNDVLVDAVNGNAEAAPPKRSRKVSFLDLEEEEEECDDGFGDAPFADEEDEEVAAVDIKVNHGLESPPPPDLEQPRIARANSSRGGITRGNSIKASHLSAVSLNKFSSICYALDGYGKSFVDVSGRESSSEEDEEDRRRSFGGGSEEGDLMAESRGGGAATAEVGDDDQHRGSSATSSGGFSILPKSFEAQQRPVRRAKVAFVLLLIVILVVTVALAPKFGPECFVYLIVIALSLGATAATFFLYDYLVRSRQRVIVEAVERSSKIVNDHFPEHLRDRLFDHNAAGGDAATTQTRKVVVVNSNHRGTSEGTRGEALLARGGGIDHADSAASLQGYLRASQQMLQVAPPSSNSTYELPLLADLFTDTTIMFADIAGFTAWSSERQPTHVFVLLERLFHEFDRATKKYDVFKVETIGDCYVAATGLPKPTPDHAHLMAAFALTCLRRFDALVNELELSLGPGTAELGLRIGLHSGPVTAGVLRGDKSRFQLFGDTMNFASRIESSGVTNAVHASAATAKLLQRSGSSVVGGAGKKWGPMQVVPRDGQVDLKGKGLQSTFFVRPPAPPPTRPPAAIAAGAVAEENNAATAAEEDDFRGKGTKAHRRAEAADKAERRSSTKSSSSSSKTTQTAPAGGDSSNLSFSIASNDEQIINADEWINTGLGGGGGGGGGVGGDHDSESAASLGHCPHLPLQPSKIVRRLVTWNVAVLEKFIVELIRYRRHQVRRRRCYSVKTEFESAEVTDAVRFPCYDHDFVMSFGAGGDDVALPEQAKKELVAYVRRIASTYKNVHFHSFEHASHVTMSANKLMNQINSRRMENIKEGDSSDGHSKEAAVFFNTYSISTDPLAQLAVVFASLTHDAGHEGIPNTILMKEQPDLAEKYGGKSVAERKSIDLAWDVLQEPGFRNLRECMFENSCDEVRFRQLIVNLLIATDIADRERMQKEKHRWERAFSGARTWEEEWRRRSEVALTTLDVSLKATVVLEQIMLASDVAHTMQHWLTFVKWNERLYKELWTAHVAGRNDQDPTANWYQGQIGFFDHYIIPLARKLNACGVFGNAGEEYLAYALSNRQEWTEKGREITERFERTIRNAQILDKEPQYWETADGNGEQGK